MEHFRSAASRLFRSEEGSASWFSIVPLVFVLIILGLALDVTNATQERTHLQVTADAAAHAALVTRNKIDEATEDNFSEAVAKAKGIELARMNMPQSHNGDVLNASNIVFGDWNSATRTFTPNPGSKDAVQVVTQQVSANGNPVSTYMLRLIGFNTWDVRALTTMAMHYNQCSRKDFGFFANGRVDLQSNNEFRDGFCIHSNDHVSINQNNFFEDGTSVTMPNPEDLDIAASGMEQNEGLEEALDSDGYTIREVEELANTINGLDQETPAYIEGQSPEFLRDISGIHEIDLSGGGSGGSGGGGNGGGNGGGGNGGGGGGNGGGGSGGGGMVLGPANLVEGKVNRVSCGNNGKVSIENDAAIENVVIITNCMVEFGSGSSMRNSIIASRNTDARSVDGPKGIEIGGHVCGTPGGNAMILTLGGVHFAAGLAFKSGQVIASGDVVMAAQDISVEGGAAVYSGGEISGTSNLTIEETCDDGSETNFREKYFRIVE